MPGPVCSAVQCLGHRKAAAAQAVLDQSKGNDQLEKLRLSLMSILTSSTA